MLDIYEARVKRLFLTRYRLDLRKIPEADVSTPDFDVFTESEHVAVLEVKGLESTSPEVTTSQLLAGEGLEGAVRRDNCALRVATKIHEAVGQLASYALPKIVVFVNDADEADRGDLVESLQGFLRTDNGPPHSSLPPRVIRRMSEDRTKADLFVWIDGYDGTVSMYSTTVAGRNLKTTRFS